VDLLSEAEGYRFARTTYKNGTVQKGIVIYTYDEPQDTSTDKLAFGFMTWKANGTIFRADSAISADYIEGKLVGRGTTVGPPFIDLL